MKNLLSLITIFLFACSIPHKLAVPVAGTTITNGKLFASYFQQQAAEYKALCFQAYNLAALRLDQALLQAADKPRVLITDIDETVLDNSVYEIQQTLQGKDYDPQSWQEWTLRGDADTVPGAPRFLNYAAARGIQVFYVTNREEKERAGTLANLRKFGLPNADNEHLVMRQATSSKEQRRLDLMKHYEVILLIGDNLADFSFLFDKRNTEERSFAARTIADQFGGRFILLPNSVYGDWESALYKYNYQLTLTQKDSILRRQLRR